MIKTYQKIRRESNQFPAYEHHDRIVSQNQKQHTSHKKVKVGEELSIPFIFFHISCCIDMNERPNEGNERYHHHRESVSHEGYRDIEITYIYPLEQCMVDRITSVKELNPCSKR